MGRIEEFRQRRGEPIKSIQISEDLQIVVCKFDRTAMALSGETFPFTLVNALILPVEERKAYMEAHPEEIGKGLQFILKWGVLDPKIVVTDPSGRIGKRPDELGPDEIAWSELTDQELSDIYDAVVEFNSIKDISNGKAAENAESFFREERSESNGTGDQTAFDREIIRGQTFATPQGTD